MKTVLITGAGPTGVTGRAIREYLENDYIILAPSSKELDLTDDSMVRSYFETHQIDFVVHCATYRSNISQTDHLVDEEFEAILECTSILHHSQKSSKKWFILVVGLNMTKQGQ